MSQALFEDIEILSSMIIDEFINIDKKTDPIAVYDCYRALDEFINKVHTVLVHYLGIPLDSDCLQNSHLGTPIDKWRFFTNKDLEAATIAARDYLSKLSCLGHYIDEYEWVSVSDQFWKKNMSYYSYIHDEYSCGMIDTTGEVIHAFYFEFKKGEKPIFSQVVFEVDTFEKRMALIRRSDDIYKSLLKISNMLRGYLMEHFTLEDILLPSKKIESYKREMTLS